MELRRPAGTDGRDRPRRGRRHVGCGRAALGPVRGRRVLLRSPEVLRLRRRAVAGRLLPRGTRPHPLDRRERPVATGVARSQIALDNSVQNQTYNTPALATLVMLDAQVRWMHDNGGMDFAAGRSAESAAILYGWAESQDWATPFVTDPRSARTSSARSTSTTRSTPRRSTGARANGVLDTFAYRKLGRNQLRIGMFPAIDPSDVEALTALRSTTSSPH